MPEIADILGISNDSVYRILLGELGMTKKLRPLGAYIGAKTKSFEYFSRIFDIYLLHSRELLPHSHYSPDLSLSAY